MQFMAFLVALTLPALLGASQKFIDNNPELEIYQNMEQCFTQKGTLYMMFRNYEEDRYFGGLSKCVSATLTTTVSDDTVNLDINYGRTKSRRRQTFFSSPGYTVKNAAQQQVLDGSRGSFNLTAVYIDCDNCHILRHSYVNSGAGCSYWVPQEKVAENNTCCSFVFDLLCGTEKYQVYDSCL
ncbi:hypothetical protein MTO96_052234 [Rhipicephalus appendiculatus]